MEIIGRRYQRRGTVGEIQHCHKEFVVGLEGLFRKITKFVQHSLQQN
jgi:hypothetical protein